jgi:hypothetical protein
MAEDLGNPAKRQKRGNAFAFVAMALAVASANIRRIIAFLTQLGSVNRVTSKNRKAYSPPVDAELFVETELGPPLLE